MHQYLLNDKVKVKGEEQYIIKLYLFRETGSSNSKFEPLGTSEAMYVVYIAGCMPSPAAPQNEDTENIELVVYSICVNSS